jgi:GH25 family lysozyme M1 (1,4-beta-N-acetylmuramidase)
MNKVIAIIGLLALLSLVSVEGSLNDTESFPLGSGVYGVDVSQAVSQSAFQCMASSGTSFVIVRGWQSICRVDPNVVQTVKNAWAGGMKHVDIYLFPSYSCGSSAATQVQNAINAMNGVKFGTLWFDIETGGGYGSPSNNMAWLQQGLNKAISMIGSSRVGIYASAYEWGQVMGSQRGFPNLPLWYASYSGGPNFANWSPFAGWSSPAMKQYSGTSTKCGVGVDLNWYPN